VFVASVWYLPNFKSIFAFAFSAGYGSLSVNYGSTNVLAPSVVYQYFSSLIFIGLSSFYFVLSGALIGIWIISRLRTTNWLNPSTLVLLSWIFIPLAATTFAVNKDPRYCAPLLPAVSLCLAHMMVRTFDRRSAFPMIVTALLAVPLFAYAVSTIAFRHTAPEFRIGQFTFWSPRLAWLADAPNSDGAWQQREIVDALCRNYSAAAGNRILIPLAHQYLNNADLSYWMLRYGCGMQVIGIPQTIVTQKDLADWMKAVRPGYVVAVPSVPEPELAPSFANVMKDAVEHMISQRASQYDWVYRGSLGPTGKEFFIYRQR
jgi:4-amino-4-deoxy-L-arabinose transferase-like glycosyltransferase